jgi:hypothetical protein
MVRRFLLPLALLVNGLVVAGDFSHIARADAIPSGTSPANYCFSITNVDRYPSYSFYAEIISDETGKAVSKKLITTKGCYGYQAPGEFIRVFAQKKSNNQRIEHQPGVRTQAYFRTNYGVKSARDILKVKSVSPSGIKLDYVEIVYTFKNGKQQRKAYRSQEEKPQPSASQSPLNLWYLANSMLAVGIVAIFYRQSQLTRQKDRSLSGDLDNSSNN